MDDADADLAQASQAGNEDAFAELVSRYRRPVYRIARGILRNHAQADEAAQDAFVKAWQGLPGFRADSSFKTWMYRIAMNAAFDLRSREATQQRAREGSALHAVHLARSARHGAMDDLIDAEDLARLRAAVDELPDKQRATLSLRVHSDLKYSEIAEVLGCHVGTAKANFHHAVNSLRRALKPTAPSLAGRSRVASLASDDGLPAGEPHDA